MRAYAIIAYATGISDKIYRERPQTNLNAFVLVLSEASLKARGTSWTPYDPINNPFYKLSPHKWNKNDRLDNVKGDIIQACLFKYRDNTIRCFLPTRKSWSLRFGQSCITKQWLLKVFLSSNTENMQRRNIKELFLSSCYGKNLRKICSCETRKINGCALINLNHLVLWNFPCTHTRALELLTSNAQSLNEVYYEHSVFKIILRQTLNSFVLVCSTHNVRLMTWFKNT